MPVVIGLKELAVRLIKVNGRCTGNRMFYFCKNIPLKKNTWLPLLMVSAILLITAFQVYWLKENFHRERISLSLKARNIFSNAVNDLQFLSLHLDNVDKNDLDTLHDNRVKVVMHDRDDAEKEPHRMGPKKALYSNIRSIPTSYLDSIKKDRSTKPKMVISIDKSFNYYSSDSSVIPRSMNNHFYKILVGVDSLKDTLSTKQIDSACQVSFRREKINIAYTIKKNDPAPLGDNDYEITLGFSKSSKPLGYRMHLENTMGYLLKKMTLPLLFSLFLLGITILSFVLLYKNMVRQKRLGEQKNDFINNITHELKTPIATVSVAIEALQNFNMSNDPVKTKEYLSLSQDELRRLSLLVDKALQFSRFEQGSIPLQMESLNLGDLADEVTRSMKPQLEKANANISLKKSGNLDFTGDRLHISGTIFNLLDNALKYCKGVPEIMISLSADDKNVSFSIRDNGEGIPPEYRAKIFEKFFRIPRGDLHGAKGYGLGLSYAWQVIHQHHGKLEVLPVEGEGANFVFSIPKNQHG
jgi:two-component system, OmpR family, phosphate regulon sensor histidine kinase PhoR